MSVGRARGCSNVACALVTIAVSFNANGQAGHNETLPARASPAMVGRPVAVDSKPSKSRRWYGWQTLAIDGAAIAILATGAVIASNQNQEISPLILDASGATFVLGPPIVHLAHGHSGKAAPGECDINESPGANGCRRHAVQGIALVLSVLGILLAPWVDAGVLAFEDVPLERRTFSVVPWTDGRTGRLGLSFERAF